ncbi:hypothetical protein QS306_07650 [Paraburkholderia bonniea]|uniref:hypothetical protein n=1 Tax=Paraburkholderia bonniea TaxID=2152891 RepID=UPI001291AFDB|nr:hypothetical protein [Paraburkholderia bonniea]WJF89025.1 hypothetical protein QS306_07650 [Paraburkholderia bonniea]WJF92341.1 hypothetical protein QS308_07660 [Paraburkholderia bonniea]
MKGGRDSLVCRVVVALTVSGMFAGTLSAAPDSARAPAERAGKVRQAFVPLSAKRPHPSRATLVPRAASEAATPTSGPNDPETRSRDGHMTPDERRLLRQHIEEAVRELYKR